MSKRVEEVLETVTLMACAASACCDLLRGDAVDG